MLDLYVTCKLFNEISRGIALFTYIMNLRDLKFSLSISASKHVNDFR